MKTHFDQYIFQNGWGKTITCQVDVTWDDSREPSDHWPLLRGKRVLCSCVPFGVAHPLQHIVKIPQTVVVDSGYLPFTASVKQGMVLLGIPPELDQTTFRSCCFWPSTTSLPVSGTCWPLVTRRRRVFCFVSFRWPNLSVICRRTLNKPGYLKKTWTLVLHMY